MQQQAIEFLAWLGMTYAGTLIVLPVMELITKKRRKKHARCHMTGEEKKNAYKRQLASIQNKKTFNYKDSISLSERNCK